MGIDLRDRSCNDGSTMTGEEKETVMERALVDHTYHDHLKDGDSSSQSAHCCFGDIKRGRRVGGANAFPDNLYDLLSAADDEGFDHIVSWQPHGRCFVVRCKQEFIKSVMPR